MPEGGAALYGEGLVRVHEGLADGEGDPGRPLEVDADKGARHRGVAGQEQGPSLLHHTSKSIQKKQVNFVMAAQWKTEGSNLQPELFLLN